MGLIQSLVAASVVILMPPLGVIDDEATVLPRFVPPLVTIASLEVPWDSGEDFSVIVEPPPPPEPENELPVPANRYGDRVISTSGDAGQLAAVANGSMPQELLQSISFAPGHQGYWAAVQALESMDAAFYADTGSHLGINNMYRPGYQGRSFHGWGLAIDFANQSGGILDWGDMQYQWLWNNAANFGFYLPFWASPSGNPEPWHWEFGSYYGKGVGDCYSACPIDRQFLVKH